MKFRLSLSQPITYRVYPGFLSPDKCLELLAWFSLRFTIKSTLGTVSALSPKEVEQDDTVSDILKKIHVQIKDIGDYKLRLEKLWCVHTTFTDSDMSKLPYIPHFDKARYLKVMLYLHDVDVEHGPIHISNFGDDNIEKRRKRLPVDYKARGLNSWEPPDPSNAPKPLVGRAGDMILFDTNAPHHAGQIFPGFERKVLRFDFVDPFLNNSPFHHFLAGLWKPA